MLRKLIVAGIVLAQLLSFCTVTDGAVRVRVTRNPGFLNPSGGGILSRGAAAGLGGVALQAEARFVDEAETQIPAASIGIEKFAPTTGELTLRYKAKPYVYKIDEASFDRIFSWVENGGTGVYTAYTSIEQQTLSDAGFKPLGFFGGAIAAEFADSNRLRTAAKYLDFSDDALVATPINVKVLLRKHNGDRGPQGGNLNWITSDIDSDFVVHLVAGSVRISGTVYKYYRSQSNDPERVYVEDVKQFLFGTADEILEQSKRNGHIDNLSEDALRAFNRHIEKHLDAVEFARSCALLRAIYRNNEKSWNDFASSYFTTVSEPISK